MHKDLEKWETERGAKFLKGIGIREGSKVLDFGARVGHYSIPAAQIVGNKGKVYAIDKDRRPLKELEQKTNALGLTNVITIQALKGTKIDIPDRTIDVMLVYDVLHYLTRKERKALYREALRILKQKGFVSFYPKHVKEDWPLDQLQAVGLDEIKNEIEESGLLFKEKHCGKLSHDDSLVYGCILNFSKK